MAEAWVSVGLARLALVWKGYVMLRSLGFIDVWPVSVTLYKHRPLFVGSGAKLLRVRPIIDEARPIMERWKSLSNLVSRAERLIAQNIPNVELTAAYIEQLEPQAVLTWRKNKSRLAIHIGLVTNPAALIYSGMGAISVQTGQVVAVEEDVWHSAVNHDTLSSRYHLVLSLETKANDRN